MFENKTRRVPGFASQYSVDRLVYFQEIEGPQRAIEREKELKGWLRVKKVQLIESVNPAWDDLSGGGCKIPADGQGREVDGALSAARSFASLKDGGGFSEAAH